MGKSVGEATMAERTTLLLGHHLTMRFSGYERKNGCIKLVELRAKISEGTNKAVFCFHAEITRINNFAGAYGNPQFIAQLI